MLRHCVLLNLLVIVLGIISKIDTSTAQPTNVAYQRSRTWDFPSGYLAHPSKAVDGCYNTYFPKGCCTHTKPENDVRYPDTWWSVDLESVYNVSAVSLTNRGNYCCDRLRNFTIYGSLSSHNPDDAQDLVVCFRSVDAVASGATEKFPCPKDFQARYIIIKKTITDYGRDIELTLCEVEVLAECNDGWYGDHCANNCSSHCLFDEPCDKVTGACPQQLCEPGYSGPMCHQECNDGWYGDHCAKKCSGHCANNLPCDKVTGVCPNQLCEPGYSGPMCHQDCPPGYFGDTCKSECHCRDENNCDHFTGECPAGLCAAGYMGNSCSQECPEGVFGENCLYNCSTHCVKLCDKFSMSGTCDGQCAAGYTRHNCFQACEDGKYGTFCQYNCPHTCKDGTCDVTTGDCTLGCIYGWTGLMCDTETLHNSKPQSSSLISGDIHRDNTYCTSNLGLTLLMALLLIIIIVFVIAYIYFNHKNRLLNGNARSTEGSISYNPAAACKKEETFENEYSYDNDKVVLVNM